MSEHHEVRIVDAFTEEPTRGNAAGVVPEAAGLTDDQLAAIAAELGASETAFVLPSDRADRRLRFFSPTTEVDLCGHATVAAFGSLYDRAVVSAETYSVETNVGVLDVDVESDGTVWLTQSAPEIRPADVSLSAVADALDLGVPALSEVGEDLPIARASTGLPWLFVPVSYFQQLSAIDPNGLAIESLCEETDAEGLYAFTFDTLEPGATLHARAFAPAVGIPEDPVTGTGAGAVGAYLRHYGATDEPDPLVVEQGHFVDRPGRVLVDAGAVDPADGEAASEDGGDPVGGADGGDAGDDAAADDRGAAPRVGGRTVTAVEGEIAVPDAAADEIIEA